MESDIEDIYTLANIYSPLFVQKEANMLVYHHIRLLMNRKVLEYILSTEFSDPIPTEIY